MQNTTEIGVSFLPVVHWSCVDLISLAIIITSFYVINILSKPGKKCQLSKVENFTCKLQNKLIIKRISPLYILVEVFLKKIKLKLYQSIRH